MPRWRNLWRLSFSANHRQRRLRLRQQHRQQSAATQRQGPQPYFAAHITTTMMLNPTPKNPPQANEVSPHPTHALDLSR